jgi:hypothetical protein
MTKAGDLFVAAHVEGTIYRFDPTTGASCAIASGLSSGWTGPSSVRVGPDGNGWALYVTVFDGTLRRLRPPAGIDLTPVSKADPVPSPIGHGHTSSGADASAR